MTERLVVDPQPGQVVRTHRQTAGAYAVEVVDEATGRVIERHVVDRGTQLRVAGVDVPLGAKQTRG